MQSGFISRAGSSIVKKSNIPFYFAETLFHFGLIYEDKGDAIKAKKYYQEACSIYQEMGWKISKQLEVKLLDYK